jgi:hypothetical protein
LEYKGDGNNMALEQLKVREVSRNAVNQIIDIPEFQRDFVWDPERVKLLAESLYCDYPVGSFLLWDSSSYHEARAANSSQKPLWIVDGQQRTTAMCLLLGLKPYWWDPKAWNEAMIRYDVMINVLPEGERLEFALPNPIRRQDPRWITLREVVSKDKVEDLTPLAQGIVSKMNKDVYDSMSLFLKIHARLQSIWQIREREVPIIKIIHEVEDVAEIFSRLNRAGTRVREADVVLALAAVRNPGWVREEYLPYRNDLEDRGWDLDAGIYIRTMTSIGHGRARLIEVPKEFWNPPNLVSIWKKTQKAISETLKRLAEFGLTSSDLLPSTNSLIPLINITYKWSNSKEYNFNKSVHWFLLANWDGRYSGSAITSLNEDIKIINEGINFNETIYNLQMRLRVSKEFDETMFRNRYDRGGNRFLRLMLYLLLINNEAFDWVDKTRIGYDNTGSPVITGFQPQWHHIYPRSVLNKAHAIDDEIHSLANITVLNERTNVNKLSRKEPRRYVQEYSISHQDLTAHMIPEAFIEAFNERDTTRPQFDKNIYSDFLIERARVITHSANKFMNKLIE